VSDRPAYEPTQEIRFAIVLYGGSSLAIYINGVVQELLHLVRATAPADVPTDDGYPSSALLADSELESTEGVYRRLGQLLSWDRPAGTAAAPPPSDAEPSITSRFVVDILSGTSAGGINGVFLAKALANEVGLDKLRELWFKEGDMSILLNDKRSYEGVDLDQEDPSSLINSRRMYWKLLSALRDMNPPAQDPKRRSRLVDELDLWITATDIRGLTLPIGLWDRAVYEKRYRNVFRLSYANPYATDPVEVRNDFVKPNDPFIAFVARCTSSFPFAFDPMELEDIDPIVSKADFAGDYPGLNSENQAWSAFFPGYVPVDGSLDLDQRLWYRRQAFGDGGYLDNKPFTWATSTLQRRRADLPVDRKLIYVEPDPGRLHARPTSEEHPLPVPVPPYEELPPGTPKPDALENTKAALLDLPRKETIRDDLEALLQRNRDLWRLERITRTTDVGDVGQWRVSGTEWTTQAPTERFADFRYAAYNRLKVATVLDELAEVATIAVGFDPDSDERSAIRCFVQAWYESSGKNKGAAQSQFLLDFDLPYRLRRLQFLQDRIDELLRGDRGPLEILPDADAGVGEIDPQALLALKRTLNGVLLRLRGVRRELRARGAGNPVTAALGEVDIKHEQLISVLWEAHNQEEADRRATKLLAEIAGLEATVNGVADAVKAKLSAQFTQPANDLDAILEAAENGATGGTATAMRALRRFHQAFEAYDSIRLPIAYGVTAESDRVEVIRISPEDATGIVDEVAGHCRKLAGIQYGHFGGFLVEDWRKNDLMWGRLDTAERLIDALLPDRPEWADIRRELNEEARNAILKEERPDDCSTPEKAAAYVATLKERCKGSPEKEKLIVQTKWPLRDELDVAERALGITHDILEKSVQKKGVLKRVVVGLLSPVTGALRAVVGAIEGGVAVEGFFARLLRKLHLRRGK
jgi:patatin-related protein